MIDIYLTFIPFLYFTHLKINTWSTAQVSFVLITSMSKAVRNSKWFWNILWSLIDTWHRNIEITIFGDETFSDLGYCQNEVLWVTVEVTETVIKFNNACIEEHWGRKIIKKR